MARSYIASGSANFKNFTFLKQELFQKNWLFSKNSKYGTTQVAIASGIGGENAETHSLAASSPAFSSPGSAPASFANLLFSKGSSPKRATI